MTDPSAELEYGLLGPLEVRRAGLPVPLKGPRLRALLAILLLNANRPVSRDRLVDALWDDWPPASAVNALQVHVSHLRKALAAGEHEVVARSGAGYHVNLVRAQLDLHVFEDRWHDARAALAAGEPAAARDLLTAALALWRGAPLAEFAADGFAGAEAHRLAEMRTAAMCDRVDADLTLGRHADVVPELDALVRELPHHERPLRQLMTALYRSGRQADALEACRRARERLRDDFGLNLGEETQQLERAMLRHDPELEPPAASSPPPPTASTLLLAASTAERAGALAALAAPMAADAGGRELVLAQILAPVPAGSDGGGLDAAMRALAAETRRLRRSHVAARGATFTSRAAAGDIVRLADDQGCDLILLDAGETPAGDALGEPATGVLADAPCAVGVVFPRPGTRWPAGSPVIVPFGGGEHDWAALELACWFARSASAPLRLVGPAGGEPDSAAASRMLASASLVVQRVHGLVPEVAIAGPALAGAARGRLVVMGVSDRWRREGLGATRLELGLSAPCPVIFVRRGLRPMGHAPRHAVTRFTWSLAEV